MLAKYTQSQKNNINIHLFLRIQQNTCSSDIEMIPFFLPNHKQQELHYIIDVVGHLGEQSNSIIISDNQARFKDATSEIFPNVIDIKDIQHNSYNNHQLIVFLETTNYQTWIKKIEIMFGFNILNKIHIIRHEGDFLIKGTKVICDCNYCLISSLLSNSEHQYNYNFTPDITGIECLEYMEYANGCQYSLLSYRQVLQKQAKPIVSYSCKKNPCTAINFFDFTPTIAKNPSPSYGSTNKPQYIAAPMIGQSELAFRMMVRHYGVMLCYTPMINAEIFLINKEYREELFTTCKEDRPLVAQFAGNNPEILLNAAKLVADSCDCIDINLGCPQPIARRHHYGAWMMEDWESIYRIINLLKNSLSIPISCKIRIFESPNITIKYAKMIESAGCSFLTIHGRERKTAMNQEDADWQHIKTIKEQLQIPVFANGSVNTLEAANQCLAITGCDGVMAASGLLANPYLFAGIRKTPQETALEYLEYANIYNAPATYIRSHILQFFSQYSAGDNKDLTENLNIIRNYTTIDELTQVLEKVRTANFILQHHAEQNSFAAVFTGNTPLLTP